LGCPRYVIYAGRAGRQAGENFADAACGLAVAGGE
jgi:hypothetical protein